MNTQLAANWSAVQGTEPRQSLPVWQSISLLLAFLRGVCWPKHLCFIFFLSFFFYCSSSREQSVLWAGGRGDEEELGFGCTEAVWIRPREAKQQTHPEFKWIPRKGWDKPVRGYTTEKKKRLLSLVPALRLSQSFIIFLLEHVSIHLSLPNGYRDFPDKDKLSQLSIRQRCNVTQIPLGRCLWMILNREEVMLQLTGG